MATTRLPERPISKRQIVAIKTAQRKLGLDDETYRQRLESSFGVRSCKDLSSMQATALIRQMDKETGGKNLKSTPRKRAPKMPPGAVRLATRPQLAKIAALRACVTWQAEDGYQRWLESRWHIKRVKTAKEAFDIIEALKALFVREMVKTYGKRWYERTDDQRVLDWTANHDGGDASNVHGYVGRETVRSVQSNVVPLRGGERDS